MLPKAQFWFIINKLKDVQGISLKANMLQFKYMVVKLQSQGQHHLPWETWINRLIE